jgi:pyruvate kinase
MQTPLCSLIYLTLSPPLLFPVAYMLQVVLSGGGTAAQLISKYRPPCPILVVSDNEQVLRGLAGYYGIVPCKVRKEGEGVHD